MRPSTSSAPSWRIGRSSRAGRIRRRSSSFRTDSPRIRGRPLEALLQSPRASKAARFALGIGDDADPTVLRQFLDDPTGRVFRADEASEIAKFFDFVTMSVTSRVQSVNPEELPSFTPDLDEL